uniref:Tail protein n=1 Tax=viral metagenome TaxID=1070528 RepID=A0A6M3IJ34_9ZZZZ
MVDTIDAVRGVNAKIVLETTYSNIIYSSRDSVWSYLRSDLENHSDTSLKTSNVFTSIPKSLAKGTGFPYVIVPSPSLSEERITFTQKKILVTFDIDIWISKSSTIKLVDRIRTLLSSVSSTFSGTLNLNQFLNSSGSPETIELPNGEFVKKYTLTIQYEWVGDPS